MAFEIGSGTTAAQWVSAILAVLVVGTAVKAYQIYTRVFTSPLRAFDGPPLVHWYRGFIPAGYLQYQSDVIEKAHEDFGPVWFGVSVGRRCAISIGDDVAIQHITRNSKYKRPRNQSRLTSIFFGDGMVNAEGVDHRRQRHVAEPSFSDRSISRASPLIYGVGERLLARWHTMYQQQQKQQGGEDDLVINAQHEFGLAALDVIGLAGFNYQFHALQDRDNTAMHEVWRTVMKLSLSRSRYAVVRAMFPSIRPFGALFVKEEQRLLECQRRISSLVASLIADAKSEASTDGREGGQTILSRMVESNASGAKNALHERDISSMIPVFLIAGHETTASALAWAFYALSRDERHGAPDGCVDGRGKQTLLRQELAAEENQGWQSDWETLDSLPYLDAVVAEVLRLFTPTRLSRRECYSDDVVPLGAPVRLRDGSLTRHIVMSKGDQIIIPVHWLNKAEMYWGPDGHKFQPERWLPETHALYDGKGLTDRIKTRKIGAWRSLITFGQGTHVCIGYRLAVAELKILLAQTINEFDVRPIEKTPRDTVVEITSRSVFVSRPEVKGGDGTFAMPCRLVPL